MLSESRTRDFLPKKQFANCELPNRFVRPAIFFMALFLPSPFADAQWNQDKKDAGSKFKNVTVLAQMPADQMGKVMNMMSASLGVNCSFCHEGTNFAKEGIGQKDAGRKMISMTLGINNEFFEGKAEVNCNTCHQGKTIPTSSISLNRAPVIPGIKNNQPHINFTPDEILEKHIQSIGGRKKLESIKSRHVIAKRLEPHGGREPEELWQTATGLTRMVTHYGKVTVVEGFDGTQA